MKELVGFYLKFLEQDFSLTVVDDKKASICKWTELQTKKLTKEEFTNIYSSPKARGAALITGYDNLEVVDVDLKVFSTTPEKVQYANILFLNKDYSEALPLLEQARVEDKANKYPNVLRMMGYAYHETHENNKAISALNNFLANRDTTKILSQDYLYLGKIQAELGQDSLSRLNYLQAFEMDSTLDSEIKVIADTLFNQKKYDPAGMLYMAIAKSTNLAADYFYATRADYLAGNYSRGIEAAEGIINKLPNEVEGYLWKARHQALLDTPNKGAAAIDPYLQVVEKGKVDPSKYSKQMLEALNWLTVYYINIKADYAKAQEYNDQALEVDANNEQVMKLFNFLLEATKPKSGKK